jgi:hypothetical protein
MLFKINKYFLPLTETPELLYFSCNENAFHKLNNFVIEYTFIDSDNPDLFLSTYRYSFIFGFFFTKVCASDEIIINFPK